MWLSYINKIESIKDNDLQAYIKNYAELFSISIYDLENTKNLLVSSSTDLFPERKTLSDCLNYGKHINLLISLFYHWHHLDWSWLFIEDKNIDFSTVFDEKSNFYLYRLIGFYPEELLSSDDTDRTLIYLFLYFLPGSPPDALLYHYDKHIPLLTFTQLSLEHFKMLLYLMKKYDNYSFDSYCKGYNLNHLLVENFLDNAKELFNFKAGIRWEDILPISKIYILLEYGCNFNLFYQYRQQKNFYTYIELPDILIYIEKKYFQDSLERKIIKKNNALIKEIIKI